MASSSVYMRASELYPRRSFARSRLPASQLSGESGAASLMSARIAWHTLCSVHAGLHAFLRMSRQISPVCARVRRVSRRCAARKGQAYESRYARSSHALHSALNVMHVGT